VENAKPAYIKYYDALHHFLDYATACRQLHALIQLRNPRASTLLDVACGTGKHVEYLIDHYQVEGIDLCQDMLAVARERSPGVFFHQGDMVDFKLDRTFDVVTCLFSSIGYVKTVERLERAIANMARHLRPGGMLVVEPWFSPEQYWVGRITANFVDQPGLKIAWMYTSEVEGKISIFDYHFLVGEPKGVSYSKERHECGLFTHEEYLTAFKNAGLRATREREGLFGRGIYIGGR
jgi:ubiquinone/menaquinone biosynthesis C-methylase UbiE